MARIYDNSTIIMYFMLATGQFDYIWEVEQECIYDRHNMDSDTA